MDDFATPKFIEAGLGDGPTIRIVFQPALRAETPAGKVLYASDPRVLSMRVMEALDADPKERLAIERSVSGRCAFCGGERHDADEPGFFACKDLGVR